MAAITISILSGFFCLTKGNPMLAEQLGDSCVLNDDDVKRLVLWDPKALKEYCGFAEKGFYIEVGKWVVKKCSGFLTTCEHNLKFDCDEESPCIDTNYDNSTGNINTQGSTIAPKSSVTATATNSTIPLNNSSAKDAGLTMEEKLPGDKTNVTNFEQNNIQEESTAILPSSNVFNDSTNQNISKTASNEIISNVSLSKSSIPKPRPPHTEIENNGGINIGIGVFFAIIILILLMVFIQYKRTKTKSQTEKSNSDEESPNESNVTLLSQTTLT